ncbi:MoaD/ThiS family protein [Mycobacterium simiae]|uniref:Molybdopterin synthase sulfur carrier subunit n=1 Tax=Mycobacterium simiae TaxID=1784 RepID=A0A5B1BSH5_MYCSI|nr:MoaD/ThiS family protein [Mycobacterium simiae]KAA1251808.1 MoaD/ThiS family protein [Mycobacterium simiae]
MPTVTVRYFGAARATAGQLQEAVAVQAGDTVAQLVSAIEQRHGKRMAELLQRCSFLLDEVAVTSELREVTHGSTLDVLPPFAGG